MLPLVRTFSQFLLLWAIYGVGCELTALLHLAVPGGVAGMLLLYSLLATGLLRLDWIDGAASLLTKHIVFFFVPIAVGLINFGPVLIKNGPAILLALAASAALGIIVTGGVSQLISARRPARI